VLPSSAEVEAEDRSIGAEPFLIDAEPDTGSRRAEGRHASPAAPFRTVLELHAAAGCQARRESGERQSRTFPIYYATAPPPACACTAS
jgi:hypothetical protein